MTGQQPEHRASRRTLLASLLTAGISGLAGCVGGSDDEQADDDGGDSEDNTEVDEQLQLDGVSLDDTFPIRLYEPNSDNRVAEIHYHSERSEWHFQPFEVPLDGWRPVEARVFDSNFDEIPVGEDQQFTLNVTRTEETPADLLKVQIDGTLINFNGNTAGDGEVVLELVDDGETVYTAPPLAVSVTG
jgi:hypothetical protein